MKNVVLLISLFLLSSFGMARASVSESEVLSFSKTGHFFTLTWELGPQKGESRFVMKTWNKDGTISGPYSDIDQTLNIFLWMPSMGHGSAPVKINKTAVGEYEISNVKFIMRGQWEIRLQVKQDNLVLDEVIVPVSI